VLIGVKGPFIFREVSRALENTCGAEHFEFSPGRTVLDLESGLPGHKIKGLHKANQGFFEPNTIEDIRHKHIFNETALG